ncbi:type IV secretion system protein VirB10 [Anaplasma centrale str. Israel]|uniref:Type IV secretion system protein VirB10 n=1 Tax=Anaplasma centrale (strain Israel) TaxID=574556 RepID=D1ATB8_ANACI|nr:TrbI/VirB10 family protein [Anaplasma centrale]ACZ48796.1 type IV secretion system protein VirB10 [Anaplasma centrale str. Israel]
MSDETKGNNYGGDGVEESVNVVGVHKSKKLFVVLVVCAITGMAYYMFFRSSGTTEKSEEPQAVIEKQDVDKLLKESEAPAQETAPRILTPPPKLPDLPPLVMPTAPELPTLTKITKKRKEEPVATEETKEILPPAVESFFEPELQRHPQEEDRMPQHIPMPYRPGGGGIPEPMPSFLGYDREKRGTPMIVLGGGGGESGTSEDGGGQGSDSRFRTWGTLDGTSSPSVKATRVGDPGYVILQGHMIDAVLETAINSDIPGVLRAIVSRDVYAEAGNMVMIPKGSRLIGSYFFDASGNNTRVTVSWARVILPHGIDIQINSAGTDELGRNGSAGFVDTKMGSVLTSTILLAGVSMGTAFVTSKIPALQSEIKDTTEEKGGEKKKEEKSSTLPVKIVSDAVKDFSESMKSLIKKYADANKPTIYVDQGTVMKVFVNQDIVFPREAVRR